MPEDNVSVTPMGSAAASPINRPQMRGERRVVTVLFADVVNSTGLAEQLDPEDWTEIMNAAFEHMTAPVHHYEGTVGRLMGDGMLAFFGAPTTHEDDPQRAILTGLDIVAAVRRYGEALKRTRGLDFDVRVGINTGSVVVADVGAAAMMENTAMGDAVNVAARMQSTAAPGTVQIAAETHRLVGRLFETTPLGPIDLKGKTEPVEAFRVTGLKAEPVLFRGLIEVEAPLCGRDLERKALERVIDELRLGHGQVVCLIGEAGLGKSRLISELKSYWLERDEERRWDTMYGVPYDINRPFGLFQNYARGMFGIQLDDPAEVIHRKVRESFLKQGATEEEFAMCAVALEKVIAAKVLYEAPDYPADLIKQDLHELMLPAFRATCATGPVVEVIDDLQWADQASVDLLIDLLSLVDEVPILFLFAFRPERQSPAWRVKIHAETEYPHRYTEIALKPLDAKGTDELVGALLKIDDLPEELHETIVRKTEGNPYFIEEVVRSLIEQGVVEHVGERLHFNPAFHLSEIAIPDSLQALLMARMDRLDQETRATLQMASVIGRSFYYRILLAISEKAMTVDKHLLALQRVELLREGGRAPELEYVFKHELARDAAYATILNRRRREFHLKVAEAIETLFADGLEEHAHRLARHFELAGEDVRALQYFEMAGDVAAGIDARVEAQNHYSSALAAAKRLAAPPEVTARLQARQAALAA